MCRARSPPSTDSPASPILPIAPLNLDPATPHHPPPTTHPKPHPPHSHPPPPPPARAARDANPASRRVHSRVHLLPPQIGNRQSAIGISDQLITNLPLTSVSPASICVGITIQNVA